MLPLDLTLFNAINASAATPTAVVDVARWVSQQLPIVVGGVLLGCWVVGSPEQRRELAMALVSMGLAWIGVQWIDHAARAGFPSMHAAGAFALAASLAAGTRRTLPWLAGSACAMAVAIAWSRVCLGVHFPSDVLAGALTGVLCACGVHAMEQQAQRINWRRRFSAYWSRRALPWVRHR